MKWHEMFASLLFLGLALPGSDAWAQQKSLKEQLVGVWTLVSSETVATDGSKGKLTRGADEKGLMILTDSGRISFQVISEAAKLAANDRLKTTSAEDKAVAQSVLSYFGTFAVNESEKSFTIRIERSSFPNQVGIEAKRLATLVGDELRVTNPTRLAGGQVNLVWRRAK